MNLRDYQLMCFTGTFTPSPLVKLPYVPSRVCPTPADNMAHVATPKPATEKDFNGLSCQDIEFLNQFRGMDEGHRNDAIAKELNRGKHLRTYLNKEGTEKFKSHYFKKD